MPYYIQSDCRIFYDTFGDASKEALLMLHGNGEDSGIFKKQIAFMEKEYYIITIDMRGHGLSELGTRPLDFDVFAEDVLAIMDFLHIEKTNMLGFSDGGNTIMNVALHYPQRILKLILNGANLDVKGIKPFVQFFIVVGYYFVAFLALFFSSMKRKKEVLGLMVHHPHVAPKQLDNIRVPVLVLVGDKDIVKHEHSVCIAQHFPHANFVILKGSHNIIQECPQEYHQAIYHFLKDS